MCKNIITQKTPTIRSGWASFLSIYSAAASDRDAGYVLEAFSLAHSILDNNWEAIARSGAFVDAVKCCAAFAGATANEDVALRAELVQCSGCSLVIRVLW